jgi:hypothetical protein
VFTSLPADCRVSIVEGKPEPAITQVRPVPFKR